MPSPSLRSELRRSRSTKSGLDSTKVGSVSANIGPNRPHRAQFRGIRLQLTSTRADSTKLGLCSTRVLGLLRPTAAQFAQLRARRRLRCPPCRCRGCWLSEGRRSEVRCGGRSGFGPETGAQGSDLGERSGASGADFCDGAGVKGLEPFAPSLARPARDP